MKSKITKLAAAAVIIIAVLIGIHHFGGSIDGATKAFAQIKEAIAQRPWQHTVVHVLYQEEGKHVESQYEHWFSYESNIGIINHNDHISFYDLYKRKKTTYNPVSDTVTISYLSPDEYHFRFRKENKSPLDAVEDLLESLKAGGAEIERRHDQYDGRDVVVYQVKLPWADEGPVKTGEIQKLIVDRQDNLLLARETKKNDSYGNIIETFQSYDYPEIGPGDVYEAGAPKKAKVVVLHNEPEPELEDILERCQFYRENFCDQYIAVVVTSLYLDPSFKKSYLESANIFFKNQELERMERRLFAEPDRTKAKKAELEMGDTFESQFHWWWRDTDRALGILFGEIYLYDTKYLYEKRREWDFTEKWTTRKNKGVSVSRFAGGTPTELLWPLTLFRPRITTQANVIEDDYAHTNNLICIEMLSDGKTSADKVTSLPGKSLFYINPDKDCICEKAQHIGQLDAPWQSDPNWLDGIKRSTIKQDEWNIIREVLEYAQTDTGKWYPKNIRVWQNRPKRFDENTVTVAVRIIDLYLKENPEFPDGIFDPKELPSMLAGTQVGTGLVDPVSELTREADKRVQCRKQLREIGHAIALYQNDFNEKNPPNLQVLVEKANLEPKTLWCPSSGDKESECSYVYRGADLGAASSPNLILAYDKAENHQAECRHVLFAGFQVKQMTEQEFQAEIARDNEIRHKKGMAEKPAQ